MSVIPRVQADAPGPGSPHTKNRSRCAAKHRFLIHSPLLHTRKLPCGRPYVSYAHRFLQADELPLRHRWCLGWRRHRRSESAGKEGGDGVRPTHARLADERRLRHRPSLRAVAQDSPPHCGFYHSPLRVECSALGYQACASTQACVALALLP